ncbi:MAG: M48 family metallopeptidase [Armatimonadetes bacterium]|nr:M48 family metallopeptidase [Armatimonadota bacterium]
MVEDTTSKGVDRHFAAIFGLHGDSGKSCQARLIPSPGGLLIEAEGLATRSVSYDEIVPSLGGTEGDHLVLTAGDPQRGGLLIYIDSRDTRSTLAQVASPRLREALLRLEEHRLTRNRRTFVKWIAAAIAVSAAVWGLWLGLALLTDVAVSKIPHKWETELGKLALRKALADKEVLQDPKVTEAIGSISSRLVQAARGQPYKFHFQVVKDQQVNAFALPGGEVVIMSGLIAASRTPEEFAGVLAHEMQHVIGRHGLRQMIHSLGIVVVAQIAFGGAGELLAILRNRAPRLLSLKFSRKQETEADTKGLELLHAARISPGGLISFFERLSRKEGAVGEGLSFISTHPASKRRIADLRQVLSREPAGSSVEFQLHWKEVRRRCRA